MRHHTYLVRCLPLAQRGQLQRVGLGPHNLVWAFHSETQEELVQLIPSLQKPSLRWAELRELGLGWWVRSNQLLRRIVEKVSGQLWMKFFLIFGHLTFCLKLFSQMQDGGVYSCLKA